MTARRPSVLLLVVLVIVGTSLAMATAAWSQDEPEGDEAQEEEGPEEAVRGTLENQVEGEDEPVEGVEITVRSEDGSFEETVSTDDEGRYELILEPGPGSYTATIDPDTLPDDVELRDEERTELSFTVRRGQSRPLLFPLGEGSRNIRSQFDQGVQLAAEGVKFGLVIAMAAVGLSLIFGTTGLVNFAHGELVTFGALVAWFFNIRLGMELVPAALLAIAVGGLAGAALDRGLWRPLRQRGTGLIAALVVSIGLSLLLRYIFLYIFGGRVRPYGDFQLQRAIELGPVALPPRDLIAIGIALAVLLAVGIMLLRTRAGKAMRAVADNPDLAASSGIDVQRVILLVWVFGSGLAALGGILFALSEQVSFQLGFQLLLLMFAGVTLGGLGTAFGALFGGFVIGLLIQVSTLWVSAELKNVSALLVLVLILLVRPQGILGQAERVG